MIDLKGFMRNTGVTRKEYVDQWIDKGLIPGAERDTYAKTYSFPDSARRPYRNKSLKAGLAGNKLRAHIVKAAINRQHITANACFMSDGEFQDMISELVKAGLIRIRVEDDIEYYDSTIKSEAYKKESFNELGDFVQNCLKACAEGFAKGFAEVI